VLSAESEALRTVGPVPSPTMTEEVSVYVDGPTKKPPDWTNVTLLGPTRRSVVV
jgi:hypothetical protein